MANISSTESDLEPARTLADIVATLRASMAFDMTMTPDAHHDLLDHGLQTATVLAAWCPDDLELQIAGLVHDIGHVLPPFADDVHGDVASDYVRPVLGDRIADLVRLHVPAKRYLCTVEPTYAAELDWGSTATLEVQGGLMTPAEVAAFAQEPSVDAAIVLRRADEEGKVAGLSVPDLHSWMPTLRAVAS